MIHAAGFVAYCDCLKKKLQYYHLLHLFYFIKYFSPITSKNNGYITHLANTIKIISLFFFL